VRKETVSAVGKIGQLFVQDILPNALTESAHVLIPGCSWAERSGCFVNCDGKIQAFESAIAPPEGCRRDGQFLYALRGEAGLYLASTVRGRMAESMPQFGALHVAPEVPQHAH
jgi:predicted molibdopterin-dependent oxidoreductase YjgC